MGWTNDSEAEAIKQANEKRQKNLSKKILMSIIILMIVIIIIMSTLMIIVNNTSYTVTVDGKVKNALKSELITVQDGITYVNIENFAELVGYEFHNNEEFKSFTKEADKCYVKGKEETTTFYINENKIYKLPVDDMTAEYQVMKVDNKVIKIGEKIYASVDTIKRAFNTEVKVKEKEFSILTLEYLVNYFDKQTKTWGYTGIADQEFENKKLILEGYLIVKKADGLYKIIDSKNENEIVSDKYNEIKYIQYKEEFFVTNKLNKVGIINLDGTVKIEPAYDTMEVFDSEKETYLVSENNKYGVVASGNKVIIPAEYDKIGISLDLYPNEKSNCYILDKLIPICKDGKWGATDKNGNIVLKLEYDGFGTADAKTLAEETDSKNSKSNDTNDTKNNTAPILSISECNGVIVKKNQKYGVVDVEGKLLIQISVDSIYTKESDDNSLEYFMIYNEKEINIIDSLKAAGLIKEEVVFKNDSTTNNTISNTVTNLVTNTENEISNNNITNTTTNIVNNSI